MNSDSICVMVVDDSHTIRKTAEKLLEKEGFKVGSAALYFPATDNNPLIQEIDLSYENKEKALNKILTADKIYNQCIENNYYFPFEKSKYPKWQKYLTGKGYYNWGPPKINEEKFRKIADVNEVLI